MIKFKYLEVQSMNANAPVKRIDNHVALFFVDSCYYIPTTKLASPPLV